MSGDRDERTRMRAHEIWEREGRPEGREAEHWEQAGRELEMEEAGSVTAGGGSRSGKASGSVKRSRV